jgi:hypothetical protein
MCYNTMDGRPLLQNIELLWHRREAILRRAHLISHRYTVRIVLLLVLSLIVKI